MAGALVALLLLGATGCGQPAEPARTPSVFEAGQAAAASCHRYASPQGSDRASGQRRRPFRTVRRLVRSLRPGRTGCLLPGRYRHRGVVHLTRPRTGLRSALRRPATVDGAIWLTGSARGAGVANLRLTSHDRTFPIPLKVQADDVTVRGNSITTPRSSVCVLVGSVRNAWRTVIERNTIRRCGRHGKLDHLIYLQHTREAVVRDNLLVRNAGGWGVHLYPDADRTLVARNVIDGNLGGVVFAGDGEDVSEGNLVRNNAITFSGPRWNVEGSWGDAGTGDGNRAERNCLYTLGPGAPAGIGSLEGFSVGRNTVPERTPYGSRRGTGYRFRAGTPCRRLVGNAALRGAAGVR